MTSSFLVRRDASHEVEEQRSNQEPPSDVQEYTIVSTGPGNFQWIQVPAAHGHYVTLRGSQPQLKTLLAISKCFDVLDTLEPILRFLDYQDLNNVYNTSKGLRRAVHNSKHLGKVLFVTRDNNSRPCLLPVRLLGDGRYLRMDPENRHIFRIDRPSFDGLTQRPRLQLFQRLLAQPPFQYMEFSVDLHFDHPLSRRVIRIQIQNTHGITLDDLVNELMRFSHPLVEHRGDQPRHFHTMSATLTGWQLAEGVMTVVQHPWNSRELSPWEGRIRWWNEAERWGELRPRTREKESRVLRRCAERWGYEYSEGSI